MFITVLLADDSDMMRKAIRGLLQEDPEIQLVAEAGSLHQAIEVAGELRPQVVVLDLHMGDEKGVAPIDVKSRLVGSRLLAISIWNDDETKALADRLGAVVLLDKSNLATELIPAIKQCGNGQEQIPLRRTDILATGGERVRSDG
jgi:two-component system response regulator DevR